MSQPYDITIEEFESRTWIADLVAFESFDGSFELPDGSTWKGTTVSERQDFSKFYTRVVGGAGKLATVLADKYYSGSVTLQTAVGDICREAGESAGNVTPGITLTTYQRLQGTAAAALDVLAEEFSLIWWIDRDGLVNMSAQRPVGTDASGQRVSSDVDASIVLVDPQDAQLGSAYDSTDPNAAMKQIRHIRWKLTRGRFQAQLYPLPFLFRNPVETGYESLYNASVDTDNGDGTIDVIVAGRFGITKVPLFCGVPGSKVKMNGGEQVMVGFFGADPQKPFAVSMAQNTNATKQVSRNGDSTQSGSSDDNTFWNWVNAFKTVINTPVNEPGNGSPSAFQAALAVAFGVAPFPSSLTGKITSGSDRLKVGD